MPDLMTFHDIIPNMGGGKSITIKINWDTDYPDLYKNWYQTYGIVQCPDELNNFWKWMFKNYHNSDLSYYKVFENCPYESIDITTYNASELINGGDATNITIIDNVNKGALYNTTYINSSNSLSNVKILQYNDNINEFDNLPKSSVFCSKIDNLYFETFDSPFTQFSCKNNATILSCKYFKYLKIILHMKQGIYSGDDRYESSFLYNPITIQGNPDITYGDGTIDMYIYSKDTLVIDYNGLINTLNSWGIIYLPSTSMYTIKPFNKLTINVYYQASTVTINGKNDYGKYSLICNSIEVNFNEI